MTETARTDSLPMWIAGPCWHARNETEPTARLRYVLDFAEATLEHVDVLLLSNFLATSEELPENAKIGRVMSTHMTKPMSFGDWNNIFAALVRWGQPDDSHVPRIDPQRVYSGDSPVVDAHRLVTGESMQSVKLLDFFSEVVAERNRFAHRSPDVSRSIAVASTLFEALLVVVRDIECINGFPMCFIERCVEYRDGYRLRYLPLVGEKPDWQQRVLVNAPPRGRWVAETLVFWDRASEDHCIYVPEWLARFDKYGPIFQMFQGYEDRKTIRLHSRHGKAAGTLDRVEDLHTRLRQDLPFLFSRPTEAPPPDEPRPETMVQYERVFEQMITNDGVISPPERMALQAMAAGFGLSESQTASVEAEVMARLGYETEMPGVPAPRTSTEPVTNPPAPLPRVAPPPPSAPPPPRDTVAAEPPESLATTTYEHGPRDTTPAPGVPSSAEEEAFFGAGTGVAELAASRLVHAALAEDGEEDDASAEDPGGARLTPGAEAFMAKQPMSFQTLVRRLLRCLPGWYKGKQTPRAACPHFQFVSFFAEFRVRVGVTQDGGAFVSFSVDPDTLIHEGPETYWAALQRYVSNGARPITPEFGTANQISVALAPEATDDDLKGLAGYVRWYLQIAPVLEFPRGVQFPPKASEYLEGLGPDLMPVVDQLVRGLPNATAIRLGSSHGQHYLHVVSPLMDDLRAWIGRRADGLFVAFSADETSRTEFEGTSCWDKLVATGCPARPDVPEWGPKHDFINCTVSATTPVEQLESLALYVRWFLLDSTAE